MNVRVFELGTNYKNSEDQNPERAVPGGWGDFQKEFGSFPPGTPKQKSLDSIVDGGDLFKAEEEVARAVRLLLLAAIESDRYLNRETFAGVPIRIAELEKVLGTQGGLFEKLEAKLVAQRTEFILTQQRAALDRQAANKGFEHVLDNCVEQLENLWSEIQVLRESMPLPKESTPNPIIKWFRTLLGYK